MVWSLDCNMKPIFTITANVSTTSMRASCLCMMIVKTLRVALHPFLHNPPSPPNKRHRKSTTSNFSLSSPSIHLSKIPYNKVDSRSLRYSTFCHWKPMGFSLTKARTSHGFLLLTMQRVFVFPRKSLFCQVLEVDMNGVEGNLSLPRCKDHTIRVNFL